MDYPPPIKSTLEFPPPIVVKSVPLPKIASRQGYPVRGSWWTGCSSWTHLTVSVHVGKFPVNYLKSLTNQEVQSLHSDDHEHRVKWEYIPGGSAKVTFEPTDNSILLASTHPCFTCTIPTTFTLGRSLR